MRKQTALRLLHLLSLLPSSLAALVCYDLTSPMHPEILVPVNCWSNPSYNDTSEMAIQDKHREGENSKGNHNKNTTYEGGTEVWGSDHDKSGKKGNRESYSQEVNLPFFNFAPDSPLSESLTAPALPPPTWDSDQKIFFNVDCKESADFCDGVKQTLDLAGWYVSQIIFFRSPLQVNASLTDFCAQYSQCNSSSGTDVILGGAVPARTFPLIDDDNIVRYYPQAVVRQMDFPKGQAPQCGPQDILMEFNSKANFFFQKPNTTTIGESQYDFLTVAIHELMHGLGFISSWADYLNPNNPSILTPQIALGNPTSQSGVQFEGFVEYAYDRLMTFANHPGLYATNLTAQMISLFGHIGENFTDASTLGSTFLSSPAKVIGGYMDSNATTRDSMIQSLPLVATDNNATLKTNYTLGPPVTLETGFTPFASGSSLNHVDNALYLHTQDFLMRFATPYGETLQDLIEGYGNNGDPNYGPFGPGLRYILAGIGYRIRGGIPTGGSPTSPKSASTTGNSTSSTTSKSIAVKRELSWGMWISVFWMILGSWVIWGY